MGKKTTNPYRTILTVSAGFLLLHIISGAGWALWISLCVAVLGLASPFIARKIDYVWMKLAEILGKIVPSVLLTVVYIFILIPLAFVSRLFKGKTLIDLKNDKRSTFVDSNREFSKSSFEKLW